MFLLRAKFLLRRYWITLISMVHVAEGKDPAPQTGLGLGSRIKLVFTIFVNEENGYAK